MSIRSMRIVRIAACSRTATPPDEIMEAREQLGSEAEGMTDEEINALCVQADAIARIIISLALERRPGTHP
jgi:hypothetical protein